MQSSELESRMCFPTGSTSAPSTGFSTPPSSSLDTCDSGIDMYSNSSTLISSMKDKIISCTTSAQINPAESESSSESASRQSIGECKCDGHSRCTPLPAFLQSLTHHVIICQIGAANVSETATAHTTEDAAKTCAAIAVDRPSPQPDDSCGGGGSSNHATQPDDNQLDLLNSLDSDNGAIVGGKEIVSATSTAAVASPVPTAHGSDALSAASTKRDEAAEFAGDNYVDDYNDDSVSDISDLSDVFKLHADILPEMQRSIDWVSGLVWLFPACSATFSLGHER